MKRINLEAEYPRIISFLGRLTISNILLSIIISYRNFVVHLEKMDLSEFIFSNSALVSTMTINHLIVFSILYLSFRKTKRLKRVFFISILTFTGVQVFFLLDSSFYLKLGLHLYAMLSYNFNFLQQGFNEMGKEFIPLFIVGFLVLGTFEYYFAKLIMPFLGKVGLFKKQIPHKWKLALVALAILAFTSEKIIFIKAQFQNNKAVKRYALAIPFYPRSLAALVPTKRHHEEVISNSELNYPLRDLSDSDEQYNLLWITLEGISNIERERNHLPILDKIAQECIDFKECYNVSQNSNKNLFASYFGLYPPYYQHFQIESKTPLLFDRLAEDQYQRKAFLSTPFSRSELKKLMFIEIEQPIEAKEKLNANNTTLQYFKSWMLTRDSNSPFAMFLHFDIAKYPYAFDMKSAKYFPFTTEANLAFPEKKSSKVYHSYLNSIAYQEKLLKDLWAFIKQNIWSKHTIIVISSDGQDELISQWSEKNLKQFKVPFLLYIPEKKGRIEKTPIQTVDIAPTVAQAMGYDTKAKYYTNGINLFAKNERKHFAFWFNDSVKVHSKESLKKKVKKSEEMIEEQISWLEEELLKFKSEN